MAFYDSVFYINAGDQSTTGYYAVAKRPQNAAVAAGVIRRQFTAPTVGSERLFICIVAGTTANVTDATWVTTRGAKTTDGTVTWQECTGVAALNGDATNTSTWAAARAINVAVTLGAIIKRNNGASYQIASTAGSVGASEPAFSDTAGATVTDGTVVWTSLGVVGNFSGGGAPFARLITPLSASWNVSGAAFTFYIADNHAELQSTNLTIAGANVTMFSLLCHNHSGSYPPNMPTDLATGAVVSTNLILTFTAGAIYVYGVIFRGGVGGSAGSSGLLNIAASTSWPWMYFDACSFQLATTGGGNFMTMGSSSASQPSDITLNNCTLSWAAATSPNGTIQFFNCRFLWRNNGGQILAAGSTVPPVLFSIGFASGTFVATLEALDLSQLTGQLVSYAVSQCLGSFLFKDCKYNALATSGAPVYSGAFVQFIRSDSSAVAYKSARFAAEGTEYTDGIIARVNGAVDPSGQVQSRKITTTADAVWIRPYKGEPYAIWNPTVGADVTVTVYGILNSASLPLNDELWMELEYLGSGGSLGKIVNTTKANQWAANAALTADSSVWNGAIYAAFDESSISGNATLTNGALTVTHTSTSAYGSAKYLNAQSTGKYYFEITLGSAPHSPDHLGVVDPAASNITFASGSSSCGIKTTTGDIYSNNGVSGFSLGALAAGDVIGVAVDLTAHKGWIRKNGGNWNNVAIGSSNPATGTGGATVGVSSYGPGVVFSNSGGVIGDNMTANFGQLAYQAAAPSGFGNWPSANWTKFKLIATLSSPQPQLPGYIEARIRAAKPSTTYYIDPKPVLS